MLASISTAAPPDYVTSGEAKRLDRQQRRVKALKRRGFKLICPWWHGYNTGLHSLWAKDTGQSYRLMHGWVVWAEQKNAPALHDLRANNWRHHIYA